MKKILKLLSCIAFAFVILAVSSKAEAANSNALHYLNAYHYEGTSKVYTGDTETSFSMMGTKYIYGVAAQRSFYQDREFYFNLDEKFTKVTFDLGNVDSSEGLQGNNGIAYIYLDGEIVQQIDVAPGMITKKVTVETSGKKQLVVDFSCGGHAYYGLGNVVGYGGHFYSVENTVPATVKEDGIRTYVCDVCGHSYEEKAEKVSECTPYLHPYQVTGNSKIYDGGEDVFTAMGVNYNYGVRPINWSGDRTVFYNLNQMYDTVTFDVGWTGAGTEYKASTIMKIYGDGTLMKSVNLSKDMIDQTITLRTSNLVQLKIELGGSNTQYGIFNMCYEPKAAKKHKFVSKVTLEPTYTTSGIKTYTCEDCGAFYSEKIEIPKYTAKFDANNGTKLSFSKVTVKKGKAIGKIPTVVRKGYKLKGWYTKKSGGTKISKSTKLNANKTYYAQWIKVTKPGQVKKLTAKNSNTKSLRITYNKASNVKGYQIVYSTKSNFSNAKKVITTSNSKTIKSLKKNNIYYVKVRAYRVDSMNNKIYGNYSSVVKVKIKK